jgi:hypothetical protein
MNEDEIAVRLKENSPKTYDTAVVGGGIAGCAAALASVRHGMKTLLIEKLNVLGGLATAGHITIYLPLDDGRRRQVITGISEELLLLSTKEVYYGPDVSKWKEEGRRYECKFNGPAYSLLLEELLLNEGVDILYDTAFTSCMIENGHCTGIEAHNKSGRILIRGEEYIDATGDAHLFYMAGEKCLASKNSLAVWLYQTDGEKTNVQKRGGNDAPGLELVSMGKIDTKAEKHIVTIPYYGDNGDSVNKFIIDGHRRILSRIKEDRSFVPASLPGIAQIRMARRIDGMHCLSDEDRNRHFADNIGATGDWRRPGPVYEIPYRSLVSPNLDNVIAAGRCISASGEAWEITRCIPQAALTGEASGTAAAIACKKHIDLRKLEYEDLRKALLESGVSLDINN